jgi:hypothetical protein
MVSVQNFYCIIPKFCSYPPRAMHLGVQSAAPSQDVAREVGGGIMAESELRNVTVNCPRCGMRAERILKEPGPITVLRDGLANYSASAVKAMLG